jgi:hypothetical protein
MPMDVSLTWVKTDAVVRLLVILSSSHGCDSSKVRTQPIVTAVCRLSWFLQIALIQPKTSFFFGIE